MACSISRAYWRIHAQPARRQPDAIGPQIRPPSLTPPVIGLDRKPMPAPTPGFWNRSLCTGVTGIPSACPRSKAIRTTICPWVAAIVQDRPAFENGHAGPARQQRLYAAQIWGVAGGAYRISRSVAAEPEGRLLRREDQEHLCRRHGGQDPGNSGIAMAEWGRATTISGSTAANSVMADGGESGHPVLRGASGKVIEMSPPCQ